MLRTLIVLTALVIAENLPARAQQVRVSGSIVSIDSSAQKLVMKMDAGPELTVRMVTKSVGALQPGQRIVVNGRISKDEKSVEALEIVGSGDTACAGPIHAVLAHAEPQRARNCRENRVPPTD
jgi:hypothetical protein